MIVQLAQTAHFIVSYDDTIAANANHPSGQRLAQSVVDYCEYDYARLSALFGITLPVQNLPISVTIDVATPAHPGGGWNDGINTLNVYVYPAETPSEPGLAEPIVAAELAEIFMVAQGKGWIFNGSNGEALSRVSGQILYPEDALGFATGSGWFNSGTHTNPPNWIDNFEPTDGDSASYGCGSLFLNYLAYQLDFTWPAIFQAGAPSANTLAETAQILGAGVSGNYATFVSLLQASFPTGMLHDPGSTQVLDDVYPLGPPPAQLPALYMRNTTSDTATNHGGPLGDSPDIIVKNSVVPNPQQTYSTSLSIANADESDAVVIGGNTNHVYLRVWNGGHAAAQNVFATVYFAPVATLVTPSMWTLIGTSYFPTVPIGSQVEVTAIGIPWPADLIPAPGHYCFVATVGCNYQSAPDPEFMGNFASFQDYDNFITNTFNVTWRNFNVVPMHVHKFNPQWGELVPLPFYLTGAWMEDVDFAFETIADLPKGSTLALQVADWIGRALAPAHNDVTIHRDLETDPACARRTRIPLPASVTHRLGEIRLPTRTAARSHLLAHIPPGVHHRPYDVAIRQLYRGREVGRVTWRLIPARAGRPTSGES